jgi:hypothetical protein
MRPVYHFGTASGSPFGDYKTTSRTPATFDQSSGPLTPDHPKDPKSQYGIDLIQALKNMGPRTRIRQEFFIKNQSGISALIGDEFKEFYRRWAQNTSRWEMPEDMISSIFHKLASDPSLLKSQSPSYLYQMLFSTAKLINSRPSTNKEWGPQITTTLMTFLKLTYAALPKPISNRKDLTTILISFTKTNIFSKEVFDLTILDFERNYKRYNEIDLSSFYFSVGHCLQYPDRLVDIDGRLSSEEIKKYVNGRKEGLVQSLIYDKLGFLVDVCRGLEYKHCINGNFSSILMGIRYMLKVPEEQFYPFFEAAVEKIYNGGKPETSMIKSLD